MKLTPMRLNRMIALSSELSRRAADTAIASGRVTVNGVLPKASGEIVDPAKDKVILDGKELHLEQKRTYIAFNKPRGYLVTKSDPEGRPTIWEILKEWKSKLNSVGRLDLDSEGLIFISDDGDFINRLTHPKHEISKTYLVRVAGALKSAEIEILQNGVELDDGVTLPAKIKRIDNGDPNMFLEVSIREGKNRQIRRMFEATGHRVTRLKRIKIGSIKLGELAPGQWRMLKDFEVQSLSEE